MRHFTLTALVAALVAVAAPTTASAVPAGSASTTIPAPKVIQTRIDGVPMFETYDGGGGLPYLGVDHPYNAGDWEDTLREYHDNGTYRQQVAKVDRVADRWVKRVARRDDRGHHRGHHGRKHHHGHGHHARRGRDLAIVFDIDETALSNYTAIEADDFTYGTESQAEAEHQIGEAIPSTLRVFRDAKKRGITVFFVTGRPEAQRQDTEENLAREGYTGYEKLYLKPASPSMTTVQYKSGARKDIEHQGYRIVANVGDQYSDLAGGHEDTAFKLPNPFYFLP
jgi:hypothetical protein